MDLEKIFDVVFSIVLFVLLFILDSLLLFVPVYFLWNMVIPDLFSISRITLFQSLGITLLCKLLFSNTTSSSKDK